MAKTKKQYLENIATLKATGQGYAGLGKTELKRRQYQAKMLTKKADAQATQYESWANAIANSSYIDIFNDEKWAREKAAGYRKIESQFDKQYSKLMKGKVTGQKVTHSPADLRSKIYSKNVKPRQPKNKLGR
jgi:hypothetical protein